MAIKRILSLSCAAGLLVPVGTAWAQQQLPDEYYYQYQDQQHENQPQHDPPYQDQQHPDPSQHAQHPDEHQPQHSEESAQDRVGLGVLLLAGPRGGVIIREVLPESPAEHAGLQEGDEIVQVNGQQVQSPQEMTGALRQYGPGQVAEVRIFRDGEERKFRVRLLPRREVISQFRENRQVQRPFRASEFREQLGSQEPGQRRAQGAQMDRGESLVMVIDRLERQVDQLQRIIDRLRDRVQQQEQRTGQSAYRYGDEERFRPHSYQDSTSRQPRQRNRGQYDY